MCNFVILNYDLISMKNILIIYVLLFSNSFAQKACENTMQISGTWVGEIEEQPIKFEISENKPDSFIFSFTNFQNGRFIVNKSIIKTNKKNEFVINIEKQNFLHHALKNVFFPKELLQFPICQQTV
jgi:hypothetical protein